MKFGFLKKLLEEEARHKIEKVVIIIAISGFVIHLLLIGAIEYGLLQNTFNSKLLEGPIAAIYTPFTFILVYEVYLLVYFIPKSISSYIGKQYEIILLIIIRRLFKDLSQIDLQDNWFENKDDLQFTYDIVTTLVVFLLIYVFYRLNDKRKEMGRDMSLENESKSFIKTKKVVSYLLLPVLVGLAVYSFGDYFYTVIFPESDHSMSFKNVNNIFFDEFFSILILTDVFLLLISYTNTSSFSSIIRNSGFIISTVLLKLSFSVQGIVNDILVVSSVSFGVLLLLIYIQYEKEEYKKKGTA